MRMSTEGVWVLILAGLLFAIPERALAQSGTGSGMRSEPAGIGEKGTGQTQSTLERSGGTQSRGSQGMTSEPSGVGEKGTGQTKSAMER